MPTSPSFHTTNASLTIVDAVQGTTTSIVTPPPPSLEATVSRGNPVETRLHIAQTAPPVLGKNHRERTWTTSSGSLRRAYKAGTRHMFDIRALMLEHRKQLLILIIFVLCLVCIFILSSGEDDTAVKDVQPHTLVLPHVRVNPALIPPAGRPLEPTA